MAVTYGYDPVTNRVETLCEGEVRVVDVVNHFHLLDLDTSVRAGADVPLELAGLDTLPEMVQVMSVADPLARLTQRRPFGRCAIVADDDGTHAVARMFQSIAGAHFTDCRIFADRSAAIAWLDGFAA